MKPGETFEQIPYEALFIQTLGEKFTHRGTLNHNNGATWVKASLSETIRLRGAGGVPPPTIDGHSVAVNAGLLIMKSSLLYKAYHVGHLAKIEIPGVGKIPICHACLAGLHPDPRDELNSDCKVTINGEQCRCGMTESYSFRPDSKN